MEKNDKKQYIYSVIPFITLLFCNKYLLDDVLGIYTIGIQLFNYLFCSIVSFFLFWSLYKHQYFFLMVVLLVISYIFMFNKIVYFQKNILDTVWITKDGDKDELELEFISDTIALIRSNQGLIEYDYVMKYNFLEFSENGVKQEYILDSEEGKLKLINEFDTLVFFPLN